MLWASSTSRTENCVGHGSRCLGSQGPDTHKAQRGPPWSVDVRAQWSRTCSQRIPRQLSALCYVHKGLCGLAGCFDTGMRDWRWCSHLGGSAWMSGCATIPMAARREILIIAWVPDSGALAHSYLLSCTCSPINNPACLSLCTLPSARVYTTLCLLVARGTSARWYFPAFLASPCLNTLNKHI